MGSGGNRGSGYTPTARVQRAVAGRFDGIALGFALGVALCVMFAAWAGCHCAIDPKDCVGYGVLRCLPDDVDGGTP